MQPQLHGDTFSFFTLDFPLLGKCHKRVIPMCGDQGYDHTMISKQGQRNFFETTASFSSLNTSDYSLGPSREKIIQKYQKCAATIRKMFCTILLPACFPEKPKQIYSICREDCINIEKDCPEFFRRFPEDFPYCADFPDGESYKGFCAHTSRPQTFGSGNSK